MNFLQNNTFPKILKLKKGFTLIELLVVIAIIGLLSSIVLGSLAGSKTKAYNAQILEEKHSLELAIQTYYSQNEYLPTTSSSGSTAIYTCVGYYANCIWPGKTFSSASNSLTLVPPTNNNLAVVGTSIGGQLIGYLPQIIFTQSVFVSGTEYRGMIYNCYEYTNSKCTGAAVYYAMFGVQPNARCTDGINSIISQNIFEPSTITPTPNIVPACPTLNANSL